MDESDEKQVTTVIDETAEASQSQDKTTAAVTESENSEIKPVSEGDTELGSERLQEEGDEEQTSLDEVQPAEVSGEDEQKDLNEPIPPEDKDSAGETTEEGVLPETKDQTPHDNQDTVVSDESKGTSDSSTKGKENGTNETEDAENETAGNKSSNDDTTANVSTANEKTLNNDISQPQESSIAVSIEGDQSLEGEDDIAVNVLPQNNGDSSKNGKRVHFSEEVKIHVAETDKSSSEATQGTTDEQQQATPTSPTSPSRESLPCLPKLTTQQLLDGVVYQAQYLGSTPVIFGLNQKTVRMQQAREAVRLLKESQDDTRPRIDIDLKISVRDLILADSKNNVDLITHSLKTVSYVADIDNSLVIMAHRTPPSAPGTPLKLNCHILETADPREVAMVIGQAFSTAYKEFLKSHGIKEESLDRFEYQHVLSSQSKSYLEINSLADDSQTREISFAKHKGEILGLMVIDSGYGSAIPSCIVAHMSKGSSASKSGLLNVGDHILSINNTSLVGMPIKIAIEQIKKCRSLTVVKMVISSCPPVTDVTIMRPDLKYQLGFSVKDGNVCSLWRGSIAERSGVRVGHRIIEINGTSVVGLSHEEIVHMLSTTVGDIHIRTMPITMYQILTGQITPEYY